MHLVLSYLLLNKFWRWKIGFNHAVTHPPRTFVSAMNTIKVEQRFHRVWVARVVGLHKLYQKS